MFAEAVTTSSINLGQLLWLVPLPPILAFAIIALFVNRSRAATTTVAMVGILASWLLSFIIFVNVIGNHELGQEPIRSQVVFLPTGDASVNSLGAPDKVMAAEGEVKTETAAPAEGEAKATDNTALKIGVVADPLNALFLFMVPLACTLIFLYSTNYMGKDPRYTRFMCYLSLFAGSMMGLVVADNLLTLFVFWELMGFCSYSLIGFFYNKPSAYKAAVKAFMTTRIGDMLLILGMVYLYAVTGSLNFYDILHNQAMLEMLAKTPAVLGIGLPAAGLIGLLIFGGTVGKSAQFPLHVWLPDAMEGPTPVSAMIHAAAMVSAGILLTLRFFPLFQVTGEGSTAFNVVAVIGAITALMGALIAVGQFDIKRVLAYSTISQLGFMVAAIGIGGFVPATFHLLTHAFFKALLFLASGSVIHGVEHGHHHLHAHGHDDHAADTHGAPALAAAGHDAHGDGHAAPDHHEEEFDPQDMRNMGGLRDKMPVTFWTFLIGGLALMGAPIITAGFWSKDEILAEAFHAMNSGNPTGALVFATLAISATLTAFYTTRQIAMTFFGKPRTEAAAHASENPWQMTLPLCVLAFFAIFAGFTNIPSDFPVLGGLFGGASHWLGHWLGESLIEKQEALAFNIVPLLTSLVVFSVGALFGWGIYGLQPLKAGETDPAQRFLGPIFTFLNRRMLFDELYRAVLIDPLQGIADYYTRVVDKGIIDPILEGGYAVGGYIAGLFKEFDRVVITGISDAIGRLGTAAGEGSRDLQTGQVQNYLIYGLGLFLVILVAFAFVY